jgi:hypothetical protein
MLPSPVTMEVKPPPRYNIKNQVIVGYNKKPGRNQVRRIASTGEFRSDEKNNAT